MELKEAIKNRRSIRKFDSKKVDNSIIKEILYHGSLAPSGKNRQPWRFVVLQENEELKNKIADIMIKKANEKINSGEENVTAGYTANIIKEAPVFIAVFNTFNDKHLNSNLQSIGACIENICLTATDMGFGSLWICDTDLARKEIEDLLGKYDMTLVAGISLGYPMQEPHARPRISIEDLVEWR